MTSDGMFVRCDVVCKSMGKLALFHSELSDRPAVSTSLRYFQSNLCVWVLTYRSVPFIFSRMEVVCKNGL